MTLMVCAGCGNLSRSSAPVPSGDPALAGPASDAAIRAAHADDPTRIRLRALFTESPYAVPRQVGSPFGYPIDDVTSREERPQPRDE